MSEVRLVDTTLRDGQQSLWAMRMRAGAMLPALGDLDSAGFDGIEFFVPSVQFPRAVRDLKEDPWLWLEHGTALATRTPLRLHGGGGSPFNPVPKAVQLLLLEQLRELGITVTRASDWWNNYDRLKAKVDTFAEYGIKTVVNIVYSVSPRHTPDYYKHKARAAAALAPYRICFKDVGGLLTPEAARELLPLVLQNVGDCEVEFHAHGNSGLATYCAGIAVESGIRVIHTAIPPLANGTSLPSVFNAAGNLAAKGYDVAVDLAPLERASAHFYRVAEHEGLPKGVPAEYDEQLFSHQVPGGMISNLRFQLEQVGMGDRLEETLEETATVRAELGFPIMVTPLSQFVATQAAINVTTGRRYGSVTDEVIRYALGHWGAEAVEFMDTDVRALILDRPRAKQLAEAAERAEPEPALSEVRRRYGTSVSDRELIARAYAGGGDDYPELMRDRPTSTYGEYLSSRQPLKQLLERLSAADVTSFRWRDQRTSITVRR